MYSKQTAFEGVGTVQSSSLQGFLRRAQFIPQTPLRDVLKGLRVVF